MEARERRRERKRERERERLREKERMRLRESEENRERENERYIYKSTYLVVIRHEEAQRGVAKGSKGRHKRQQWRAAKDSIKAVAKESRGG